MDGPPTRAKKITSGRPAAARQHDNLLLATLSDHEHQALCARCESVDLSRGQVLCEQGARIRYVYFPTRGFISLVSSLDEHSRLEVGLIGDEGMLGASLILGVRVAPMHAIVQGAGAALRMEAAQFPGEIERSPALGKELNSYLYLLVSQLAQTAACTRFHVVEARLARWLLMTRDRAHSDEFHLTQELMAYMLGVRRAGITRAAGALRQRKLIHYSRGHVTILDSQRLEAASCGCYAAGKNMYAQIMR